MMKINVAQCRDLNLLRDMVRGECNSNIIQEIVMNSFAKDDIDTLMHAAQNSFINNVTLEYIIMKNNINILQAAVERGVVYFNSNLLKFIITESVAQNNEEILRLIVQNSDNFEIDKEIFEKEIFRNSLNILVDALPGYRNRKPIVDNEIKYILEKFSKIDVMTQLDAVYIGHYKDSLRELFDHIMRYNYGTSFDHCRDFSDSTLELLIKSMFKCKSPQIERFTRNEPMDIRVLMIVAANKYDDFKRAANFATEAIKHRIEAIARIETMGEKKAYDFEYGLKLIIGNEQLDASLRDCATKQLIEIEKRIMQLEETCNKNFSRK